MKKNKIKRKISKVMREFKSGKLRSGSKNGKIVTNPKQAIAISLSEAGISKKKSKKTKVKQIKIASKLKSKKKNK